MRSILISNILPVLLKYFQWFVILKIKIYPPLSVLHIRIWIFYVHILTFYTTQLEYYFQWFDQYWMQECSQSYWGDKLHSCGAGAISLSITNFSARIVEKSFFSIFLNKIWCTKECVTGRQIFWDEFCWIFQRGQMIMLGGWISLHLLHP